MDRGEHVEDQSAGTDSQTRADALVLFGATGDLARNEPLTLGMVGLGRMGGNIVRRLLADGHSAVVHDVAPAAVAALADEGALGAGSLADLAAKLPRPRAGLRHQRRRLGCRARVLPDDRRRAGAGGRVGPDLRLDRARRGGRAAHARAFR